MTRQYWVQSIKPELEGRLGTVFALSNGLLGLRGHHEEMPAWGRPEFYIAGTYTGGPASLLGVHDPDHILTHPDRMTPEFIASLKDNVVSTLPNFPNPLAVRLSVAGEVFSFEKSKVLSCERLLDMPHATLRRCLVFRDSAGRRTRVESRRFVSFAHRHLVCLQYRVTPLDHDALIAVQPYVKTDVTSPGRVVLWDLAQTEGFQAGEAIAQGGAVRNGVVCVTKDQKVRVSICQAGQIRREGKAVVLDLFAAAAVQGDDCDAAALCEQDAGDGFEKCLGEHVRAYGLEAQGSSAEFDEDPDTVQGFNFGQMHMHMAFPTDSRVGVPIKGYTGHGYRFANFWDTDFHMFPYYLLTRPRQARRLLEYRYGQLDAYRANARKWGSAGAQVPWETQADGCEVTAPWLCLQEREIHISADAAWMFKLYDELTSDHDAMVSMGAEFTFETARFYASRITWVSSRGRYELPDIGCPDQYHTFADNNVFISRLAKWNLQQAIELSGNDENRKAAGKIGLSPQEIAKWKEIVANFYIIGPNEQGIIEEFDGYFALSSDLDGICETYCRHSQAVKQPDVLATFWPFEDLYSLDIRRKNWLFYAARTLHGSSLSLPGMAHSAARCGLNDEALYYLHKSCRMDLDDVNLDSERGVHLTGGALQWYTVVFGFGGLTPRRDGLHFVPNLPRGWGRLAFAVHWQFQRISVELVPGRISLRAWPQNDRDVPITLSGGPALLLPSGQTKSVEY